MLHILTVVFQNVILYRAFEVFALDQMCTPKNALTESVAYAVIEEGGCTFASAEGDSPQTTMLRAIDRLNLWYKLITEPHC